MTITRSSVSQIILFLLILVTISLIIYSVPSNAVNGSLSQEQINQIEEEPITIMRNCELRFDFDQAGLCFAFYQYLEGKCFRLDFLPSYCGTVVTYNTTRTQYIQIKITQTECEENPPLPEDTEGVKRCVAFVDFDSRYYSMPPGLKIADVEVKSNESKILSVEEFLKSQVNKTVEINKNPILFRVDFEIENPNVGGIEIMEIAFNVSQKETTVFSDRIGSSGPSCGGLNYIGCVSYPIEGLTNYHVIREIQIPPSKIDLNDSKYRVDVILDYKYNSSQILTKSFTINYP